MVCTLCVFVIGRPPSVQPLHAPLDEAGQQPPERGIGVVLSSHLEVVLRHNPHPLQGRTDEVLAGELAARFVLARRDQLDITEDVISILNSR